MPKSVAPNLVMLLGPVRVTMLVKAPKRPRKWRCILCACGLHDLSTNSNKTVFFECVVLYSL